MKPPVPYFGSKGTLGPKIAAVLPPHQHYVEPFGGSLAVLLAKAVSPFETVNDLDQALITFWRVLRSRPVDLAHACALTPHSRLELQRAQAAPDDLDDELEVARHVFVQLTQGRSGLRRRNGWRQYVKPSGNTNVPDYLLGYLNRIWPAAERLSAVSLECLPAIELIEKFGREPEVLIYADPPYMISTRSKTTDRYIHEMRDETPHRELAGVLHAAKSAVVLSGYASPLYDDVLFPDWYRLEFPASTGQGGVWANRVEVLWANRPFATAAAIQVVPEEQTA